MECHQRIILGFLRQDHKEVGSLLNGLFLNTPPGLTKSGGSFTAPAGDPAAHRSLSIQTQAHGKQHQGKGSLSQARRSEQAGFCPSRVHPRSFHKFPLNSYLHDTMRQSLAKHLRDPSQDSLAPCTSATPSPALIRCWLQQPEVSVLGSQAHWI